MLTVWTDLGLGPPRGRVDPSGDGGERPRGVGMILAWYAFLHRWYTKIYTMVCFSLRYASSRGKEIALMAEYYWKEELMRLVNKTTCVKCGKNEYSACEGKSSRIFYGMCDKCVEIFVEKEMPKPDGMSDEEYDKAMGIARSAVHGVPSKNVASRKS